jgi:hypothetical protein
MELSTWTVYAGASGYVDWSTDHEDEKGAARKGCWQHYVEFGKAIESHRNNYDLWINFTKGGGFSEFSGNLETNYPLTEGHGVPKQRKSTEEYRGINWHEQDHGDKAAGGDAGFTDIR